MIFLLATYLFALSKHFIDNWAVIKEKQLEKTQYEKAWNYLYQHQNKQGKKKMEEAWEKGSIVKALRQHTFMISTHKDLQDNTIH